MPVFTVTESLTQYALASQLKLQFSGEKSRNEPAISYLGFGKNRELSAQSRAHLQRLAPSCEHERLH
jgi:hypothetical protein